MSPNRSKIVALSRKYLLGLVILLSLCGSVVSAAQRAQVSPYLSEGDIIYLPLRETCNQLGFEVDWDPEQRSAMVEWNGVTALYPLGEGAKVSFILEDRIYVPLEKFAADHQLYYVQVDADNLALLSLGTADTDRMVRHMEVITEAPRPFASPEILKVRDYLAGYLEQLGYEVTLQEFEHVQRMWAPVYLTEDMEAAELTDDDLQSDTKTERAEPDEEPATGEPETLSAEKPVASSATVAAEKLIEVEHDPVAEKGYNVVARKAALGDNRNADILILGAHYDTVAPAPGANDNGSGTVALLEIAELIKDLPSHMELRLVFFDCEELGLIGSFYYVQGLSDNEIDRIVGMINLDMFAAVEENGMWMVTADGKPNYLTKLFDGFTLSSEMGSDHSSFYSLAIPAVSLTHNRVGPYHQPEDNLEHLDLAKLSAGANKGTEAAAYIMSDASPSFAGMQEQLNREQVSGSLDPNQRLSLYGDIAILQEKHGLQMVQIPVKDSQPMELSSAYAAMVQWWGLGLETHFQYRYAGRMLDSIKIIPTDVQQLVKTLDEQYSRFANAEEYYFYSKDLNAEEASSADLLAWRSDAGNAFVLLQDGAEVVLLATSYYKQEQRLVEEGWLENLSDREQAAWARVEELLLKADLLGKVTEVSFVDDGYGDVNFDISGNMSAEEEYVTVTMDINDLLHEKGSLYQDEDLVSRFINGLARLLFDGRSQKEFDYFYDENGNIVGYGNESYLPDSYIMQYVEAFGPIWEKAVRAYYTEMGYDPDTILGDMIISPWEMMSDMQVAFAYYVTGVLPFDYDTENIAPAEAHLYDNIYGAEAMKAKAGFFEQFPELVGIKEKFGR